LIAYYQTAEEAEPVAKQLKTLGLKAFIVNDSELTRSPSTRFNARALELGEQAVVFRDSNNRTLKMETKDVFLILKGKYQLSSDKAVTTTRMKFNLTATLVTGGIPIWKRPKPIQAKWDILFVFTVGVPRNQALNFLRIPSTTHLSARTSLRHLRSTLTAWS
jgi:hypothetical protein